MSSSKTYLKIGDSFTGSDKSAIGRALAYFAKDRKNHTCQEYIISSEGFGQAIYVKGYNYFGNSISGGGFNQIVFVVEQAELHDKITEFERRIALEDAGCE